MLEKHLDEYAHPPRPTRLSLATSRHHTLGASLHTGGFCRALDADPIRLTRVRRYRTLYGTTDAELRTVHSDLLAKHAQLLGACAADPPLLRVLPRALTSEYSSLAYCSQCFVAAHWADMSDALNRSDAALDEHLREVRRQLSASPLSFPPLPSPFCASSYDEKCRRAGCARSPPKASL